MPEVVLSSPFGTEPIEEIALERAPLARVLAQVRFPRLGKLVTGNDTANAVARSLSDQYPEFNESREFSITLTPEGVTQSPTNNLVWNLVSPDKAWQVSFGGEFLALHSSAYTSRSEFVHRLRSVLAAFADCVAVPSCDRVGVRYINRIDLAEVPVEELLTLVRQEMHGGLAVPLDGGVELRQAMNEALYDTSSGAGLPATMLAGMPPGVPAQMLPPADGLQARWGKLPGGAQLDITLPPLPGASWVLDLDAFSHRSGPFDADTVAANADALAERAYRYFRWVVTGDFLTLFGARP